MKILVGCEESGKVRDAFIRRGHNAISCDILPTRVPGPHLRKDIMELLSLTRYHWDLIILFPDCTAMSLSGNRWYGAGMPRHWERIKAIAWTAQLWNVAKHSCKIGCAIENPTSVLWGAIGSPQYIQPWEFGHGEQKKTGILTHNLPPLIPTDIVDGREERIWNMAPSPTRKRDRAETFDGIAEAIADQWGNMGKIKEYQIRRDREQVRPGNINNQPKGSTMAVRKKITETAEQRFVRVVNKKVPGMIKAFGTIGRLKGSTPAQRKSIDDALTNAHRDCMAALNGQKAESVGFKL